MLNGGDESFIGGEFDENFPSERSSETAAEETAHSRLAKFVIDKKLFSFKIEAIVCIIGGAMSIVAMFLLYQVANVPLTFVLAAGFIIDAMSVVMFCVFHLNLRREISAYNNIVSHDSLKIDFKHAVGMYISFGKKVWLVVPVLLVIFMVLELIFVFNRIAFGILCFVLYSALAIML